MKVTRAELNGRMKSKLDIYRVLTKEGQLFLPPYTECTMDFMADIIQGKKKVSVQLLYNCSLLCRLSRIVRLA